MTGRRPQNTFCFSRHCSPFPDPNPSWSSRPRCLTLPLSLAPPTGYDPRDFALVSFGGAGSVHANAVAKLMGSWPVIVPPSPGLLCAFGDATTRTRNDCSRSFVKRFTETDVGEILTILRSVESGPGFKTR